MLCFSHPDIAAVGVCKACYKGLCRDCAADLGHSLACKDVHEEMAASVEKLITRNVTISNVNRWAKYTMPIFYSALGIIFLNIDDSNSTFPASRYMGLGFLGLGVWLILISTKLQSKGVS